MITIMHDMMFAVAPYIVPLAGILFLGGWFVGMIRDDIRYPVFGMLATLTLIALIALCVFVYWAIGGTHAYPNG